MELGVKMNQDKQQLPQSHKGIVPYEKGLSSLKTTPKPKVVQITPGNNHKAV